MKLAPFPFQTSDWSSIPKEEHKGEIGIAHWQMQMMNDIRVRMVEYSPGYKADHWCSKGHIIYCIEGEMVTGRKMKLSEGMTSYQ